MSTTASAGAHTHTFTAPAGPKGATGPMGPPGPQGPSSGGTPLRPPREVMTPFPTITVGGPSSTISGSTLTAAVNPSTGALTGPYVFSGGTALRLSGSPPLSSFLWPSHPTPLTQNSDVACPWAVEFTCDADKFEAYVIGVGGWFRFIVDGKVASDLRAGSTNSSAWHLLVEFGAAASRVIRFESLYIPFAGIKVGPGYSISAPPAGDGRRVIVLGDSITQGSAADHSFTGWVQTMGYFLGWQDVRASGIGSTGYLDRNTPDFGGTFRERVQPDVIAYAPDTVIVAGGINDGGFTVGALFTEAGLLFAAIRAGLPNVKLIVLSPFWPGTPPVGTLARSSAIAAAAVGATFIDMLTLPWIMGTGNVGAPTGDGNADLYTSADGTHPTQAGHDYIGLRMAYALS